MTESKDGGGNANAGGSGNDQAPAWLASMPDDLKADKTLAQFPTIGDAGKELVRLKGFEGQAIVIPGEKATDAERAAFYTKLGRPETADKYTIAKPADLPEGVPYNPEIEGVFKQFAFEKGIPDATAKEIFAWYWNGVKTGHEKQQQVEVAANEAAINQLKDEWKGDTFKVNTELAARAFKKFGGDKPEVVKFIEETKVNGLPLGNHPMFLRVFAAIGQAIADDSMSAGGRGGGGGELSDEEKAKARFPNTYKK